VTYQYDVIVVGAGLGGMSAATFLAKNGLSVLLLERHNVPGGFATSFVRGRYEFEIALHELSGAGSDGRGDIGRYLNYLGVLDKIEIITMPNLYRSIFPDMDVTLPAGLEAYEAKLCELFPDEAKGISKFLGRIVAFYQEFSQISKLPKRPGPMEVAMRYPNFFRYMNATWAQVLYRDVKSPRARAVISQYWGYFGLPPSQINFMYFALGLASYLKYGPSFIKGRSQTLSNAFIATLEEHGGQVRFNCGVKSITVENGQVTGVITDDGTRYQARWVVSNADPIATCRRMIDPAEVPDKFFRRLQASTIGPGTVNVYLGVNLPPEKIKLTDHENFINPDDDFDAQYEMMKKIVRPTGCLATLYNHVYPEISPPGTSVVVLTALAYGEPWYDVPPDKYVAVKNDVADAMLDVAEKYAPGLREYAEVVEVATPLTNMRYAGTLGGSIYGFDQPPHDNVINRMGHRGPLAGLYFVGAWTQPGGGFGPCMISGQMAGSMILKTWKQ